MYKLIKKNNPIYSLAALAGVAVGGGGGGGGGGGPVSLYSASLTANDANPGTTFRICVPIAANGLSDIRMTIQPGSLDSLTILNASIGKRTTDPAYANTTAAPIELLFGGASGFVGKTTPQTSDWASIASLALTTGDQLVCIYDIIAGSTATASQGYLGTATGVITFYKIGTASYNVSDVTADGYSFNDQGNWAISSVETQ